MTKWTSVKDETPTDCYDRAVLLNNQIPAIAFCLPKSKLWYLQHPIDIECLSIPEGYRVTHWAELPKLPEE